MFKIIKTITPKEEVSSLKSKEEDLCSRLCFSGLIFEEFVKREIQRRHFLPLALFKLFLVQK